MYINEYFNSREEALKKAAGYKLKTANVFECKNKRWCLSYNPSASNYESKKDEEKQNGSK